MSRSIRDLSRRGFLAGSALVTAGLTIPSVPARAQEAPEAPDRVIRNMSGFRAHKWQPYFANLKNGAVLVDIDARSLHYWSEDQSIFRVYPTSVPVSPELTKKGRTEVVQKVVGPSWAPTPSMKERNPEWPDFVGPGPDNPLGTHALYLSWQYYRIHGTHDTRKIGRQSSNGCIGLYNEDIQELFSFAKVGTQVLLI